MKNSMLFTFIALMMFTGCSRQDLPLSTTDKATSAQFDKLDTIINGYLDKLDDPKTTMTERKQILCYAPLLRKHFPNEFTQAKLDKDLKIALDYYKGKDNIQC